MNIIEPDFEKFPKLKNLEKAIIADLEPGDILFLPNYWFHEVHTTEMDPDDGLNFSMNFWYPQVQPEYGKQLFAKNYVCISRNIEKMIGQVVPNPENGDVGRFLKMILDRYENTDGFPMIDEPQ